jgi:hypothetical protein
MIVDHEDDTPIKLLGGAHDGSIIRHPPHVMKRGEPIFLPTHPGHISIYLTPGNGRERYERLNRDAYACAGY